MQQTTWVVGIFSAALLLTAACADTNAPEGTNLTTAANAQDVTSGGADDPNSDSDAVISYGWTRKIVASADNGFLHDFSLSDIVTNVTVKVRKDNTACVACHSWAAGSDRQSFCDDHVDTFLSMPTAKFDGTDPPSAKPASLKAILKTWKAAGCPD